MTSALCDACRNINAFSPLRGPVYTAEADASFATRLFYRLHGSVDELKASAAAQCHLCFLVLDGIEKADEADDDWEITPDTFDIANKPDLAGLQKLKDRHSSFFRSVPNADSATGVLLEVVFRRTGSSEPATRGIDVVVHWPEDGGHRRKDDGGHRRTDDENHMRTADVLSLVSGLPSDIAQIATDRAVFADDSTNSPYALRLARFWLKDCVENHASCHKRNSEHPSTLPTRVIDVGTTKAQSQPFLYISKKEQAPYVCLSHCWGKAHRLKTELHSLRKHQQHINVEEMPKTFQDAVAITRNLGIRYLWIDSLCIVQDSPKDWQKEAADMGRIYHDSTVTISAMAATGDDRGCFMPRSGAASALCRTPMFDELVSKIRDAVVQPSLIQRKLIHLRNGFPPSPRDVFRSVYWISGRLSLEPLDRRAWTLQESVLSFRSLNYGARELQWCCPTLQACECAPEGFPRQSSTKENVVQAQPIGEDDDNNPETESELYASWHRLVNVYSMRQLTFSKDKLPALSGLAMQLYTHKQSAYLAGIWQDNLRIGLAWYLRPAKSAEAWQKDKSGRPAEYRAPSWSWASVDGEILNPMCSSSPSLTQYLRNIAWANNEGAPLLGLQCEILDCRVQLQGLNPFGEVGAGSLVLRGRLKHALVGASQRLYPPTGAFLTRGPLSIFDDRSLEECGGFQPDDWRWSGSELWCIPLLADAGSLNELLCLALIPRGLKGSMDDDAVGKEFTRAGMVWMYHGKRTFEADGRLVSPVEWFADAVIATLTVV